MDFNFVNSRLATGGGIATIEDVKTLIKANITHIVNCRNADESNLLKNFSIVYFHNPTADDGKTKPPYWFQQSIEFALTALLAPSSKIYVHCTAGSNRGPSTAYAILRALGLSSVWAEMMIRMARPSVCLAYKNDADKAIVELGFE